MQDLPPGWTPDRIKSVIEHYDNQTEDEAVEEDESTDEATWMQIPTALVPQIRELLMKQAS
jgi:hypothetical protein